MKATAFLAELRRRRVFRVTACYVAAAVIVVGAVSDFFPALNLPPWTVTLVAVLAVLGLPATILMAWAFDWTPGGPERTPERAGSEPSPSAKRPQGRATVRRAWLTRAGLSVPALLLVGWLVSRVPGQPPVALAIGSIVVMPFSVQGPPELQYLGPGMVDLLGRSLNGASDLRSVDATAVLRLASLDSGEDPAESDLDRGLQVAERLGAAYLVTGSIHQAGGRLRLHASLHGLERFASPKSESAVEGEPADFFLLVDRLTAELLADQRSGSASQRLARSAATTTGSLSAFKSYLDGEAAFRSAAMDRAVDGYQRAISEDSGFALAYYRLASAYWWHNPGPGLERWRLYELSRDAAERAFERRGRLGPRDAQLVEALVRLHGGAPDEAERSYRQILYEYPDDTEARFQLANLMQAYNPLRGRALGEALSDYRLVLEADPDFFCPI